MCLYVCIYTYIYICTVSGSDRVFINVRGLRALSGRHRHPAAQAQEEIIDNSDLSIISLTGTLPPGAQEKACGSPPLPVSKQ